MKIVDSKKWRTVQNSGAGLQSGRDGLVLIFKNIVLERSLIITDCLIRRTHDALEYGIQKKALKEDRAAAPELMLSLEVRICSKL